MFDTDDIAEAKRMLPIYKRAVDLLETVSGKKTEQTEQEPLYWEVRNGVCNHGIYRKKEQAEEVRFDMQKAHDLSGSLAAFNIRPLYAAPVRTKDLTDDEIDRIACNVSHKEFVRAVIAADREKNK